MADDAEAEAEAPPAPGTNKVEIHVGGHVIVVESPDPLADVVGYAIGLHEQTALAATRIPMGFDITGGQFDRADAHLEPGGAADPGEDDGAR